MMNPIIARSELGLITLFKLYRKQSKSYGVQTVKNRVLDKNMKKFHTPKRDAFADNKEAMRDFSCKEVVDGLWFLTNYSSEGHLTIIHELEVLFPRVKSELIYA